MEEGIESWKGWGKVVGGFKGVKCSWLMWEVIDGKWKRFCFVGRGVVYELVVTAMTLGGRSASYDSL